MLRKNARRLSLAVGFACPPSRCVLVVRASIDRAIDSPSIGLPLTQRPPAPSRGKTQRSHDSIARGHERSQRPAPPPAMKKDRADCFRRLSRAKEESVFVGDVPERRRTPVYEFLIADVGDCPRR